VPVPPKASSCPTCGNDDKIRRMETVTGRHPRRFWQPVSS
jgi:hypothetical protein